MNWRQVVGITPPKLGAWADKKMRNLKWNYRHDPFSMHRLQ
ncbi:hypothetical protein RSSM_01668 [Rhodopirellula sallentina SM41]|uniref:Uncharacterized protein n=1 Tax=Rhodopirellula sallentina SM41 TaxID=1263870 RepID=M5ULJ9_9BACT|nr:hypothetical protein RSSM_01668 [Rhodopirellula sallentina SM41]